MKSLFLGISLLALAASCLGQAAPAGKVSLGGGSGVVKQEPTPTTDVTREECAAEKGTWLGAPYNRCDKSAERISAEKALRQTCEDQGGTWSGFKMRCDHTGHKHPFSDKKWWIGFGVIAGMAAGQGVAVSKVKTGGTWAFGTCGPCTTNRDIALFAGFANVGSFTLEHWLAWYLGHDDPNKAWRTLSYVEVPAIDTAVGIYIQNKYGWGHKALPVDPNHPCTAEFSQCF